MFQGRRRRRRIADAVENSRPTGLWVLLLRAGNSEAIAEERLDSGPCRRCVTAAAPTGPLVLPRPSARAVKKAQPAVLLGSHQVLLHKALRDRLEGEGLLEGLSRRPVRVAGDEATSYEQVMPTSVLPPLDSLTVGVELDESLPPCPECGRDGRYDDPNEGGVYVLPPSAALGAPWQSTWEHFGRSRTWDEAVGNIAAPRMVISGAVRDVMRAESTRADFIELRQRG